MYIYNPTHGKYFSVIKVKPRINSKNKIPMLIHETKTHLHPRERDALLPWRSAA